MLTVFEDADRDPTLIDRGALNFVIVGAGATGTELAEALMADLINDTMPDQYPRPGREPCHRAGGRSRGRRAQRIL